MFMHLHGFAHFAYFTGFSLQILKKLMIVFAIKSYTPFFLPLFLERSCDFFNPMLWLNLWWKVVQYRRNVFVTQGSMSISDFSQNLKFMFKFV